MLPGEALLTVRPSLIHCQHVGVGRAGEHQLPHREVPHRPQASASSRAREPLRALYTFVRHGLFSLSFFGQILPTTTCVCWAERAAPVISFCLSCFFFSGPLCVPCGSHRPLLDRRRRRDAASLQPKKVHTK